MTVNKKICPWLNSYVPNHKYLSNFPKDKIRKVLHPYRGSIFLLTSRYEGFSLSLIEAMSQGLIPIAFPVGVAPEIIINGENGFLVNDIKEAHERIKEILSNDGLRVNMSTAAYITSLRFRANILAKKLVSLYQKMVKKPHKRIIKDIKIQNKPLRASYKDNKNSLITKVKSNETKFVYGLLDN